MSSVLPNFLPLREAPTSASRSCARNVSTEAAVVMRSSRREYPPPTGYATRGRGFQGAGGPGGSPVTGRWWLVTWSWMLDAGVSLLDEVGGRGRRA